jgi:hypothetical protein
MRAGTRSRSPTAAAFESPHWPWASAGLVAFMLVGVVAVVITLSIVFGS